MRGTLASFPYVTVRLACRLCSRAGTYRLARLADRYGADMKLAQVLGHLAGDCKYWGRPRHPIRPGCGAYFVDLGESAPRPPDEPPAAHGLRVIKGGR